MTFEEWMQERLGSPPYTGLSRELWDAATAAERERCAEIAIRKQYQHAPDYPFRKASREIAATIRETELE